MSIFEIVSCTRLYDNELYYQVAEVIRSLMPPRSISIWMLCVFALPNYNVITSGMLMTVALQHKEVTEITLNVGNIKVSHILPTPLSISLYNTFIAAQIKLEGPSSVFTCTNHIWVVFIFNSQP